VLILSPSENKQHIEHTSLYHYTYNWSLPSTVTSLKEGAQPGAAQAAAADHEAHEDLAPAGTTQAMVLGLGSMFNHSRQNQNVGWTRDPEQQVIVYRALKDIAVGEELCISYGDHLTFVDVDRIEHEGDAAKEGEDLLSSFDL
jgi:uncharacterized protein